MPAHPANYLSENIIKNRLHSSHLPFSSPALGTSNSAGCDELHRQSLQKEGISFGSSIRLLPHSAAEKGLTQVSGVGWGGTFWMSPACRKYVQALVDGAGAASFFFAR
jgi:hypothetical protein